MDQDVLAGPCVPLRPRNGRTAGGPLFGMCNAARMGRRGEGLGLRRVRIRHAEDTAAFCRTRVGGDSRNRLKIFHRNRTAPPAETVCSVESKIATCRAQ